MPFTDLLRVTVFITGAEATALGAITAIGASRENDTTTILVAAGWWLVSLLIGFYLGRPSRAAEDMRDPLARARTATSLPSETPARIALGRLWPIALTAVLAGGLGLFFPGVAVIGAGYALIVSLAWHTREAAVLASSSATASSSTSSRPTPCARSSSSAPPACAATGCAPGTSGPRSSRSTTRPTWMTRPQSDLAVELLI